jgi:hypothetical protein
MREWVVLAETDPLGGLTHSVVNYVTTFLSGKGAALYIEVKRE